jgi:hypothetical protein
MSALMKFGNTTLQSIITKRAETIAWQLTTENSPVSFLSKKKKSPVSH